MRSPLPSPTPPGNPGAPGFPAAPGAPAPGAPRNAFASIDADELERLARRLIHGAAAAAPVGSPATARHRGGGGIEDVLLDVEIEGVRCVVVRYVLPASGETGGARGTSGASRVGRASGTLEASGAPGAGGPAVANPEAPEVALSPREREIARMVACGYPNKTIAGVLEISSWTVSTHLRRIFAKLAVTSRAAMAAQLTAAGLMGDPRCDPGAAGVLGAPGAPGVPGVPGVGRPRRPAP